MTTSPHLSRVRLNVEVLEGRELPSSFLPGGIPTSGFLSSQAQTVQAREAARRTSTSNTLRQIGLVGSTISSTTWSYSTASAPIIGILVAL